MVDALGGGPLVSSVAGSQAPTHSSRATSRRSSRLSLALKDVHLALEAADDGPIRRAQLLGRRMATGRRPRARRPGPDGRDASARTTRRHAMTLIGYTMMCEQARSETAGTRCRPRRGSWFRLRGHQRPLLPVARLARPLAVRVERARRGGPGDRPHSADDVRHLPDPSLSPRRRRAEGGDDAAAVRRSVHPRARRGREPERTHRRRTVADRRRAPRDARGGGRDHPSPLGRAAP